MAGVCSAGLKQTALPVTRAAVTMPVGMARGKFHGAITAPTPRASVAQRVGLARRRLHGSPPRLEAAHLPAVVLAEVDGLAHVGVGLGPRLAGLEDLEGGQLGPPGPHPLGGPEQHRRPARRPACRRQPAHAAAAGGDGGIGLRRSAGRRHRHRGRRPGRVDRRLDPAAVWTRRPPITAGHVDHLAARGGRLDRGGDRGPDRAPGATPPTGSGR